MRKLIFNNEIFHPGEVRWNELFFDEEKALEENINDLNSDQLWVRFLNGANLSVDWLPDFDIAGGFVVTVSQNEVEEDWTAIRTLECRTVSELRKFVVDQIQFALSRPPVAQHVFDIGKPSGWIFYEEKLILDHFAPIENQLARLQHGMLDIGFSNGNFLEVGWEPSHDPSGRFIILIRQDSRGKDGRLSDTIDKLTWTDSPHVKIVRRWDCRSIIELKSLLETATMIANEGEI